MSTEENPETHLLPPTKPYHNKIPPSSPAPRNIPLKLLKFLRDRLFQRQESTPKEDHHPRMMMPTSKEDHHPLLLPQGKARKRAENKPPPPYNTHLSACQPKSPRTARSAASYPQVYSWRRSPRSCGACFGAGAGARPRGTRSPLLPASPPWCWCRHGPSHRQCPCGPWRTWGGQFACWAQRWTRIWKHKEVNHKASWESASKLWLLDLDSRWICTHLQQGERRKENLVLIIIVLSQISVITINTDILTEFAMISYPLPGIQSSFSLPKINHITGSDKDWF